MTTNQALQEAAERWKAGYDLTRYEPLVVQQAEEDANILAAHAANLITSQPPTTDERARHAEAIEEAIKAVRQLYDYALHLCYEHSVPFYSPVGPQEVKQMLEPVAAFIRGSNAP